MVRLKTVGSRLGSRDRGRVSSGPKRADAELLTAEHRARREEVLRRAGYQCEWVMPDGDRCPRSWPAHRLIADHIDERKGGGAVDGKLQCLCVQHNTLKAAQERAKRHQG